MSINEIKSKIRFNSLVKTPNGWRYVCFIHEDGVGATERDDDLVPFPPRYKWEEITDVRN